LNFTPKEKEIVIKGLTRLTYLCGGYNASDTKAIHQLIARLQNEDKESNYPVVPIKYGGTHE